MIIKMEKPDFLAISQAVESRFKCLHGETRKCAFKKQDGRVALREQCLQCGQLIGGDIRQAGSDLEKLPLWDDKIHERWAAGIGKAIKEAHQKAEETATADWTQRYTVYLKTTEWKRRAALVKLRAQGICEGCRENPAAEVHHLTYEHCGEEFLFELVALCGDCHERFHEKTSNAK